MNIEEIIRRAHSEGRFDDLPGKGKPLHLANRQSVDVVTSLAKEAGFAPPWVQLGKDIDASEDAARRTQTIWRQRRETLLAEAGALLQRGQEEKARQILRQMAEERDRIARSLAERWVKDRRTTRDYNLLTPGGHQQRPLLSPEKLLRAFLEESPDSTVSSEAPPQIVSRPPAWNAADLVKEMEERFNADSDRKPGMTSQRAEALMTFKSRMTKFR